MAETSAVRCPTLSIGLPVYNGAAFLAQAVDAILAQDFTDFELLICDNASDDGTSEIAADYAARDPRVRHLRATHNHGAARNFNWAFTEAFGRYFKWAAVDDLHASTFASRCVEVLDAQPDVVLAHTQVRDIDDGGAAIHSWGPMPRAGQPDAADRFADVVLREQRAFPIFGVMRTAAVSRTSLIGPFTGSDYVVLVEMALQGRFVEVPEELFWHREHDQRSTRALPNMAQRVQWFDTSRSAEFAVPYWQMAAAYCRAPHRLGVNPRTAARAHAATARWMWTKRGRLRHEVKLAAMDAVTVIRRRLGRESP